MKQWQLHWQKASIFLLYGAMSIRMSHIVQAQSIPSTNQSKAIETSSPFIASSDCQPGNRPDHPVSPSEIDALIQQLKSPKDDERLDAVIMLRWKLPRVKMSIPHLIPMLKDANLEVRISSAVTLQNLGEPTQRIVPSLLQLLQKTTVRRRVINILGTMGESSEIIVPQLIPMLKDADPEIRAETARTIGSMKESAKDAIPYLIPMLQDPNRQVRLLVIYTLREMGELAKDAIPQLKALANNADDDIRTGAAFALTTIDRETRKAVLADYLAKMQDIDPSVRQSATYQMNSSMGRFAKDAVPQIVLLLKDQRPNVRASAISVLTSLGESRKDFIPQFVLMLKDSDHTVRIQAVYALGGTTKFSQEVVYQIIPLLKDPNREVRIAASRSLASLGENIIPLLVQLLQDQEPLTRSGSACALGLMGESAKPAIPELIPLLKDTNETTRLIAKTVLQQLGYQP
jgi:HEAT repeat protein